MGLTDESPEGLRGDEPLALLVVDPGNKGTLNPPHPHPLPLPPHPHSPAPPTPPQSLLPSSLPPPPQPEGVLELLLHGLHVGVLHEESGAQLAELPKLNLTRSVLVDLSQGKLLSL